MKFFLKPKFLLGIICILLLVNIATFIGILVAHDSKEEAKCRLREEFYDKLGLSSEQRQFFYKKREEYKKLNNPLYDKYDSIMVLLQKNVPNPDSTSIKLYTDSLGTLTSTIRKNWIQYSIEVRETLNADQKIKFDHLTLEHLKGKMKR